MTTPRAPLAGTVRRWVVTAVVGLVLLLGCGTGAALTIRREDTFREHAATTSGVVTSIRHDRRGTGDTVRVAYRVAERDLTASVHVDGSRSVRVGDRVDLSYDPDDPTEVVASAGGLVDTWLLVVLVMGATFGLAVTVVGAIGTVRLRRRARAEVDRP